MFLPPREEKTPAAGFSSIRQPRNLSTIRDILEMSASMYSSNVALRIRKSDGGFRETTYGELYENVRRLAGGLVRSGIEPGDKVAILSENRPEWTESYLALSSMCAVAVPLDIQLKAQEIRHILQHSGARAIIASGDLREKALEGSKKLIPENMVFSMESFPEPGGTPERPPFDIRPEDLAALIYTSGTTGSAKAVMLSNLNIASNVDSLFQTIYFDRNDNFLSILPLHHTFEATCGMLLPLSVGASITYARSLKSRDIMEDIRDSRATIIIGVPLLFEKMYRGLLQGVKNRSWFTRTAFSASMGVARSLRMLTGGPAGSLLFRGLIKKAGLSSIRLMVSGGAPLNPDIGRSLQDIGLPMIQGYGLTETSPVLTVDVPGCNLASVGKPICGVEIRIIKPDSGGIGEIAASGPNIMMGYYGNEAATEETFLEGWLLTGDLGFLDENGCLFITGRAKNVIVSAAGKNIYPEELESQLLKSPLIEEVLVHGDRNPVNGREDVHAIVYPNFEKIDEYASRHRLKLDEAAVEELLKEEITRECRSLADYKKVKHFSIRDEEFPKTTTRKIKRSLFAEKKIEL
jgi:long-chain acyl-CoA synthetase